MSIFTIKNPNDQTIDAYNNCIEQYIQQTPLEFQKHHAPLLKWLDYSLSLVPKNGKILEIGSGTGREAQYIRGKDYRITLSDASDAFVDYLISKGENPIRLNVLTDKLPHAAYHMILANAVITHFTQSDFSVALEKIHNALQPKGLFAVSARQGRGEFWTTEKFIYKRYLKRWQPEELKNFISSAGYDIIFMESNISGDLPSHTWINLTAQKH